MPQFHPGTATSLRAGFRRVRLSKIDDYLADIFCVSILSDVAGVRVKQKAGGLLARFQIGNLAPSLSATDAEPGGAAARLVEQRRTGQASHKIGRKGWASPHLDHAATQRSTFSPNPVVDVTMKRGVFKLGRDANRDRRNDIAERSGFGQLHRIVDSS